MRYAVLLCCVVMLVPAAASAQATDRPTRKGDPLTVTGCLSGGALQATEVSAPDAAALLAGGLTFRLTGKKALLKQLRETHDRKVVEVRGVLKSELQGARQGRSLGGMRIAIGAPAAAGAGRLESEPGRVLPVLEVTSFEGSGRTPCGR